MKVRKMGSSTEKRKYEVKQFDEVGNVEVVRRWFFEFYSKDSQPLVYLSVQAEPRSSVQMDREPEKRWQVDDLKDVPEEVRESLREAVKSDIEKLEEVAEEKTE
jgi:hypothetical protein